MTQSNNQNGDRLDRIESILLNLANASVRHDNEFSRVNTTLDRVAEQQRDANIRHEQQFSNANAQIETNRQQIAILTASIQDLRNLVATYIQSRSQIEDETN